MSHCANILSDNDVALDNEPIAFDLGMDWPPVVPGDVIPCVSVVVPAFREVDNIRELVLRVTQTLRRAEITHEIIIVDDHSRDGTDEVVQILELEGHPVRLVTRTHERGLSTAVVRGFHEARGDVLVCMDADLSHPPEKLPELIAQITEHDAEFVIGSRYVQGGGTDEAWGFFRWLNSRVATILARPFSRARDPMAGFFALPGRVFRSCESLDPIGYKIGLELLVKSGCQRVHEVPIQFADRKRGKSKLTLTEQWRYLYHLKKLADYKYTGVSQLTQFCTVGASGMLADLLMYSLLLSAGLAIGLARAAAILVAMNWNFVLNHRVTFAAAGARSPWRCYVKFLWSCSFGGAISWAIAVLAPAVFPWFGAHLMLAALLGIGVSTLVNFQLSREWVFTRGASGASGAP